MPADRGPCRGSVLILSLILLAAHRLPAGAQVLSHELVVPQRRVFAADGGSSPLAVREVAAWVGVVEQVATTSLRVTVANTSDRPTEAELVLPVPVGAVVRSFSFQGDAGVDGPGARLLERDEARQLYESIVDQLRDPALLEFCGLAAVRSRVFPVPASGVQRLNVVYEQVLPRDGARIDYVLPRSESGQAAWIPWTVEAWIKSRAPLGAVFSSSHEIHLERGEQLMNVHLSSDQARAPGALRLSWLLAEDGPTSTLMSWPRPDGPGGSVLFLAGLPDDPGKGPRTPLELTVVVDRSGSMRGEKLEQARAAALSVLDGLGSDDRFRLLAYSDGVEVLSEVALQPSAPHLDGARHFLQVRDASGGTALQPALLEALRPAPSPGRLAAVLFLTDGVPTVGPRDEWAIHASLEEADLPTRRLFTFGVGDDVNAPLLDSLAERRRGASSFVHPHEDVEVAVSQVFDRLTRPVMIDPRLEILQLDGRPATDAWVDQEPAVLPDLFAGEPLSVLARYTGDAALRVRLRGRVGDIERSFETRFEPAAASSHNDVVPRLWAARRIAGLVDRIRQARAGTQQGDDALDAELVDDVVALSLEHGILTEFTAFFAEQGTDLSDVDVLRQRTRLALAARAQTVRVGRGAVVQAVNLRRQRMRLARAGLNSYRDRELRDVRRSGVRQVGDATFFRRAGTWLETAVVRARTAGVAPTPRVVTCGSSEYLEVARRLTARGRAGVLALGSEVHVMLDGDLWVLRSS